MRLGRLAVVIAGAGLLAEALAGPVGPAMAQKRPGAQMTEKERALQQTRKQLREERAKAAAARRREAGLLSALERIDRGLIQKRRQVAVLDRRVRQAQKGIAELRGEIRRLETRRTGQEEALGRRLEALYKLQVQGGALAALLSREDPLDQAIRLRHLTTLATVDARYIQEYRRTSEGLAERQDRQQAQERKLAALRAEAEAARAKAGLDAGRRRVLLAKVKGQRAYHDRAVGELSDASRRLEAFIRDLQAKQRQAEQRQAEQRRAAARVPAPAKPRTTPSEGASAHGFGGLRGRLGWPVDGQVVGEFGAQVHPRFGTRTFRSGIDIVVPEGTAIAAVYPGHVVYTGWFRGYGNLIIVDHGGDYFTLYAHAAEFQVTEGDEVKQGQTIGTVGETGSLQGPRLYFEVRHQGKPQDPAQWLRPRG
jgi:septal ring factor EnvC (AmiA/AmiB activator)